MDTMRADITEARHRADAAAVRAAEAMAEIVSHERVCAERYAGINDKLRELASTQRNAFIGAFALAITIIGALIAILLRINSIPA